MTEKTLRNDRKRFTPTLIPSQEGGDEWVNSSTLGSKVEKI